MLYTVLVLYSSSAMMLYILVTVLYSSSVMVLYILVKGALPCVGAFSLQV